MENNEDTIVEVIKKNATRGKIVVEPILRAVDIATGEEGEQVI